MATGGGTGSGIERAGGHGPGSEALHPKPPLAREPYLAWNPMGSRDGYKIDINVLVGLGGGGAEAQMTKCLNGENEKMRRRRHPNFLASREGQKLCGQRHGGTLGQETP